MNKWIITLVPLVALMSPAISAQEKVHLLCEGVGRYLVGPTHETIALTLFKEKGRVIKVLREGLEHPFTREITKAYLGGHLVTFQLRDEDSNLVLSYKFPEEDERTFSIAPSGKYLEMGLGVGQGMCKVSEPVF